MSIETAVFAVRRGDQQFSCKGSDLLEKLTDGDILLVNRGGVDYQFELEEQGKFKLIKNVDFRFNADGAIVITQNAEATGGDTPYKLTTEYDIELGTGTLGKKLVGEHIPSSALALDNKSYYAFGGEGSGGGSGDGPPTKVFTLDIENARYVLESEETKVTNRHGLKRFRFNGKDILIDVWNEFDGQASNQTHTFTFYGLEETKIVPKTGHRTYLHLHTNNGASCCGFVTDKNGNYYGAWHNDALYQYFNIPEDSLGYPNFKSKSITGTKLVNARHYFKGLTYHEPTHSIYYSNGRDVWRYDIESARAIKINMNNVATDDLRTSNLVFTETHIIRTLYGRKGILDSVTYAPITSFGEAHWNTISNALFINDEHFKYLFKLVGGETVKVLDYDYQGDPFADDAPWRVFRDEPLPPGYIGGAAVITLDPFTLMWSQDDQLLSWGVIPDQTAEATVNQTITDTNGDSVSSSTTKAPL